MQAGINPELFDVGSVEYIMGVHLARSLYHDKHTEKCLQMPIHLQVSYHSHSAHTYKNPIGKFDDWLIYFVFMMVDKKGME